MLSSTSTSIRNKMSTIQAFSRDGNQFLDCVLLLFGKMFFAFFSSSYDFIVSVPFPFYSIDIRLIFFVCLCAVVLSVEKSEANSKYTIYWIVGVRNDQKKTAATTSSKQGIEIRKMNLQWWPIKFATENSNETKQYHRLLSQSFVRSLARPRAQTLIVFQFRYTDVCIHIYSLQHEIRLCLLFMDSIWNGSITLLKEIRLFSSILTPFRNQFLCGYCLCLHILCQLRCTACFVND